MNSRSAQNINFIFNVLFTVTYFFFFSFFGVLYFYRNLIVFESDERSGGNRQSAIFHYLFSPFSLTVCYPSDFLSFRQAPYVPLQVKDFSLDNDTTPANFFFLSPCAKKFLHQMISGLVF